MKNKEDLKELECDRCDGHICYVDDFDLNGSKFYCDDCANQI